MDLIRVNIEDIVIKSRIREDMGDLEELSKSIQDYGLLVPILINKQNILISGFRRVEACRLLGHSSISALVMDLEDEDGLFYIECQENLCRKPLTPKELDKEIEKKMKIATSTIRSDGVFKKVGRVFSGIKRLFSKKQ
jgi:ParB/RepB/Spo0J family partition protein